MNNRIGKGGYGNVYLENGVVKKVFKEGIDYNSIITEIVASTFFHDNKYVLKIKNFDIKEKWHTTDYYIGTFKTFMRNTMNDTLEEKITHMKSLIYAISTLHNKGIIHGDLKPSNVLYNGEYFVIGDLGFTCPPKYSKCARTAKTFREPIINYDYSHDIYSLGIIMLMYFTDIKLNKLHSNSEKIHFCSRIENHKIKNLVISCLNENGSHRPNINDIYFILYDEIINERHKPEKKSHIPKHILDMTVRYSINNSQVFYKLSSVYNSTEYNYYIAYICSCIFGGKMTIKIISKKLGLTKKYIRDRISKIITNINSCKILYTNYK